MLTIAIRDHDLTNNAGFLDHTLLATLALSTRSDLWQPIAIHAALTGSLKFHTEQVKKWAIAIKQRVLICKLELQYAERKLYGLFVPVDEEWPFASFSRIDYHTIHMAARVACQAEHDTESSLFPVWSK